MVDWIRGRKVRGARRMFAALALAAAVFAAPDAARAAAPIKEVRCLALTIYFEARGEPHAGQLAVAHVVMNRVADSRFPDTICQVVRQGGDTRRFGCQFTWWCDGRSDRPRAMEEWYRALIMAVEVYCDHSPDPTGGALWYHATYVSPSWRKDVQRLARIGHHVFYGDMQRIASAD